MYKDKFIFAQLVEFMDKNHFNYLARKYDGDKYVRSYTYWNQLLTMMFGQLSNRESLRDLIVAMEAHAGKLYHLRIGKSVTRSNLSKALEATRLPSLAIITSPTHRCSFISHTDPTDLSDKVI